jgi:cobaltochelatase CobT
VSAARQYTRQHQKVEDLCAAMIRAVSGEADIHYRGQRLHQGRLPLAVHAPHLQPDPEQDDFSSFRGTADSIALRLLHSDTVLHRLLCPNDPVERLIFELLEQLRVESMASDTMPGMTQNLCHRFSVWSRAFHQSGLTESSSGILLYTLFQITWSRMTGQPVLERTEDLIESTRAAIVPVLGIHLLGMRRSCADQATYAQHAGAIAAIIGEMIRDAGTEAGTVQSAKENDDVKSAFRMLLQFDSDDTDTMAVVASGQSKVLEDAPHGYAIFSTQYDRQGEAGTLVRKALLREYRERIDLRIAELGINIPRLARLLTQLLALPQRDGWSFGEEEGTIDGRRLAQLITSPAERRLFRQEQYKPDADCLVSFLVDCSGSMKTHAESVTILIDVLVQALEQAGVGSEVLGFTTGGWNGGRVQRNWLRARSPKNPGRLNELFHMVFKTADQSWRRARPEITALLKADLYREGIDGEAVDWACRRLQLRNEKKRILVVISDGCPMDSATSLANDEFYLANHLKQVVADQELRGDVCICGLGVGLDLSTYYRRSLAIDLPDSLNNGLFFEIAQLIGVRQRQ